MAKSTKPVKWVVENPNEKGVFWPSEELKRKAWMADEKIYEKAAGDPIAFWEERAAEGLEWYKRWDEPYRWEPP